MTIQIDPPNPIKIFQRQDLEAFNALKNPIWVFDAQLKSMYWGNNAALRVWSAGSLEELINRDFASDMSDAISHRLQDYLLRFRRGEEISEQVCE
jgi:hypothetical protein